MLKSNPSKPVVFIDADVLIAGAASPSDHSASILVLRLAEITLIETYVSEQVIVEVERNLEAKFSDALPAFRLLANRCLTVVPDPSADELTSTKGLADPKDLPTLLAALRTGCSWLVTFNKRHYQPGHPDILVLTPGEFIMRIREQLTCL